MDGCNPVCEVSRCGDGFVDPVGADGQLGTPDDEACDEGSYCADGTLCSHNPSICAS